LQTLSV